MKLSTRRPNLLFLALGAAAITACAPMRLHFGLLARESDPFDVEVLERDVEACSCSWWKYPPYSEAISDAIARVPGADAMIDVTFRRQYTDYWLLGRFCVVVTGAVGRVR